MSTAFGLTDNGFLTPALTDIRADLSDALQAAFGASIDVGDYSVLGQFAGILAERLALIWQGMQTVSSSQDPDMATGLALDALCALTGTVRPAATYSTVTLTLTGDPSTVVPIASVAATPSAVGSSSPSTQQFVTTTSTTLVALTAWAQSTAYVTGDRRTANGQAFQCTVGGTSGGTGAGPQTTDVTTYPVDGTVTWQFLGTGTAAADQAALATITGPVTGGANDITIIVSAFSGWSGVCNLAAAVLGRDIATDAELRQLRVLELSSEGTGTPDAIRAELLNVLGVTAATVFVNNTDAVDGNGQAPHSVQALVQGGADQDIFDALLANVAAGVATDGTTSGTAADSQGTSHTMKFTRPIVVPIYVTVDLIYDPENYPADGDDEVIAAIVAFGALQPTGKDAVSSSLGAQAFNVLGVDDVTHTYIDVAPSPTLSTTIAIDLFHLATYDSSRIIVNSTPGTP